MTPCGHLRRSRRPPGAVPIFQRVLRRYLWTVSVGLVLLVFVSAAAPSDVLTFPTSQDVIDRILAAARRADLTSVAMLIKFRIGGPETTPPACVFQGVLHVAPDHTALTLAHWTPSPLCWTLERYVLGRLFADRDHVNTLLPSFRFDVLGEKLVDDHPYYLVYGSALTPRSDPQWMIGWVDYDRGLIVDGTIQYAWGAVNLMQDYGLIDGVWVLVHQDIDVPRFTASLEISYSEYQFMSHP